MNLKLVFLVSLTIVALCYLSDARGISNEADKVVTPCHPPFCYPTPPPPPPPQVYEDSEISDEANEPTPCYPPCYETPLSMDEQIE
ncbi:unnamed protein product [Cochlearia groenlandica]